MLLGAWLLHSIRLAAALGMAIVVMQAPAVTREYQAALLQLVRSSGEDIAQRKASAQRFYGIPIEKKSASSPVYVRSSRRMPKPLPTRSRARRAASYDRIERGPDLWRPITAARDVPNDNTGARRQIAQTVFESFAPQLDLSFAAAIYALAGLFLGSLIGELATAGSLSRQTRTVM
jgi:hypothetical protein